MSPGRDKNNMPNHTLVETQDEKIAFQKKTKFTIAFDSVAMPGFATEKILHAFASKTIPIYFGDPHIGQQFNKKAFIDVADYDFDLNRVLERVIEIDNNDELYLEILSEPAFLDNSYIEKKQVEFENFLVHIFNQDLDKAYRRCRVAAPKFHEGRLLEYNKLNKNVFCKIIRKFTL